MLTSKTDKTGNPVFCVHGPIKLPIFVPQLEVKANQRSSVTALE
ncbi:unnamed protein product [Schistosoma curassoni]|uniref:Uncharacterized protein n=1 Tax=Schistosoma curassoni TaxID=6186 RepID=A0A183KFE4_9TREM|nr:unnamed protein product [Schistosoma curassoni]